MFLTKRQNGIYYVVFEQGGKRRIVSTKTKRKSEAYSFLKAFVITASTKESKIKSLSLSEFFKEYLAYSPSVHSPHSTETCKTVFKEMIRIVGDLKLTEVKPKIIDKFLAAKHAETSASNVRRYYVTLAAAFEIAKKWEYTDVNPFRAVKRPKVPEVIPAYFTVEEFRRLMSAIQEYDLRTMCMFALNTGMRLGEITQLKWFDVDLLNRKIIVGNSRWFTTKSKKNRTIPINDSLKDILSNHAKARSCELVFHQDGSHIRDEFVSKSLKKYVLAPYKLEGLFSLV